MAENTHTADTISVASRAYIGRNHAPSLQEARSGAKSCKVLRLTRRSNWLRSSKRYAIFPLPVKGKPPATTDIWWDHQISEQFLGTSYNLLTNNCNHFTSALCERLTSKPAPGWLNRAASIGLALPCMVPREWVAPPDVETAEGELCDERREDEDEDAADDVDDDERSAMLESDRRRERKESEEQRRRSTAVVEPMDDADKGKSLAGGNRIISGDQTPPPRLVSVKDTSGREMPVAERAPIPKQT